MAKNEDIYFRDLFRQARAIALKDAEDYQSMLFALEKFGFYKFKKVGDLGKYEKVLCDIAKDSAFSSELPDKWRQFHTPFNELYEFVRNARNDALHQGAFARHLTNHAIQLLLILEDALMTDKKLVSDFMVRDVEVAEMWQPISFIRQQMLMNSFSYMPVFDDEKWKLISDFEIAKYLNVDREDRKKRLAQKLSDVTQKLSDVTGIKLEDAKISDPKKEVSDIMENLFPLPILIVENSNLLGILTAFDLL